MSVFRLFLSLCFFVPAFVLMGERAWGDNWYGLTVCGLVGAFFGFAASGEFSGRWLDGFFPPVSEGEVVRTKKTE